MVRSPLAPLKKGYRVHRSLIKEISHKQITRWLRLRSTRLRPERSRRAKSFLEIA